LPPFASLAANGGSGCVPKLPQATPQGLEDFELQAVDLFRSKVSARSSEAVPYDVSSSYLDMYPTESLKPRLRGICQQPETAPRNLSRFLSARKLPETLAENSAEFKGRFGTKEIVFRRTLQDGMKQHTTRVSRQSLWPFGGPQLFAETIDDGLDEIGQSEFRPLLTARIRRQFDPYAPKHMVSDVLRTRASQPALVLAIHPQRNGT